jgi:pimeloyl-ACP methyl ester carboxylesterase
MTIVDDSRYTRESTSHFAQLGDIRIHYHDIGSGPVLLLLHGGGPGASAWSNFHGNIAALAGTYRLLMVDQPGFGFSDKPVHDEPQHELTTRLLVELLDHLGIDTVTPIGNSMGGAASLQFTLDHPSRVDRLVLMAPAGGSLPVTSSSPTSEGKFMIEFGLKPSPTLDDMRELVNTLTYDGAAIPDSLVAERHSAATDPEAQAYNVRMFQNWMKSGRAPKQWRRVDEIEKDTLLLWGREDAILPLDSALHMAHSIRKARLVVLPLCGHWVMIEQARAFEYQILRFMDETS